MVQTEKLRQTRKRGLRNAQAGSAGRLVLDDVQNECDDRQIPINRVGVGGIKHPIVVRDGEQKKQATVARLDMSVDLPHHTKGTHMSRFIEILNEYQGEMNMRGLAKTLLLIKERLGAERARIDITFPYFIERVAPVSGATSLLDYECSYVGELNSTMFDYSLKVRVPVNALCPCSKRISDYGAHNQRSYVTISVNSAKYPDGSPIPISIKDLVDIAERSASAPVYPLVKRVDERYLTMQAYDNPVFVEDTVRSVASQLIQDSRVAQFSVQVVSQESIHNHDAFASIDWHRPGG